MLNTEESKLSISKNFQIISSKTFYFDKLLRNTPSPEIEKLRIFSYVQIWLFTPPRKFWSPEIWSFPGGEGRVFRKSQICT